MSKSTFMSRERRKKDRRAKRKKSKVSRPKALENERLESASIIILLIRSQQLFVELSIVKASPTHHSFPKVQLFDLELPAAHEDHLPNL